MNAVARLALTDADRDGRDLVVGWMHDLGMQVSTDAVGNVVGVHSGTDSGLAPVMIGSHIDTVRTGGRFDGNLGVLAGLQVVETLITAGVTTRRPVAVAFFTGEEGARFQPDMLGSPGLCRWARPWRTPSTRVTSDGVRLGDDLARIGYAGMTPCPAARSRTPTSSCTSNRGRCWRTRASPSARSPGCRGSAGWS